MARRLLDRSETWCFWREDRRSCAFRRSTTMLRLNQEQRVLLAEKLCDAGNLAAGALVFGQFLADRFSVMLAAAGLAVWMILIGSASFLLKGSRQ